MSKKHQHNHTRRKFLGNMGCASLGITTMLSSLTNLGLINAAAAANMPIYTPQDETGYKALVCLALVGGNDSYNMLTPKGNNGEYTEYAEVRGNMALTQDQLLDLNNNDTTEDREFGIHQNMSNLRQIYQDGHAAFIANVGSLVKPITMSDYQNGNNLPLGLYSHLDQLTAWHTSLPNIRGGTGWGGRLADLLYAQSSNSAISMNISLDGTNVFQSGNLTSEYTIDHYSGAITLNNWNFSNEIRNSVMDNMMDQTYQNILKQGYANSVTNSQESSVLFSNAIAEVEPFVINIPTSSPSQLVGKLNMVAKTIAATMNGNLDMNRQIFYVQFAGFDTHGNSEINGQEEHSDLLAELDTAIGYFWDVLAELNAQDKVTLFSISDFARTLSSNGNGTDHGWGGNAFVIGGAVNGSQIYGQYPSLYEGNDQDTGQGRLIPTTSCDEYFAELAMWFAHNGTDTLSNTQLDDILPNLNEFWAYDSNSSPIGFLNY